MAFEAAPSIEYTYDQEETRFDLLRPESKAGSTGTRTKEIIRAVAGILRELLPFPELLTVTALSRFKLRALEYRTRSDWSLRASFRLRAVVARTLECGPIPET